MKQYLSIGKVASLKKVSIKSLRYYDEIGILRPALINPDTSYRYYTVEQLPVLDAVTACIELGIPLKELKNYVRDNSLDYEQLLSDCKALAARKQASIQQCLDALSECAIAVRAALHPAHAQLLSIDERAILTLPYSPDDNMNQKLLQLFMLAQTLHLKVSYPTGIRYFFEEGIWKQELFLMISKDSDQMRSSIQLNPSIRIIPAGNYYVLPSNIMPHDDPLQFPELYSSIQNDFYVFSPIQDQKNPFQYEIQYAAFSFAIK